MLLGQEAEPPGDDCQANGRCLVRGFLCWHYEVTGAREMGRDLPRIPTPVPELPDLNHVAQIRDVINPLGLCGLDKVMPS